MAQDWHCQTMTGLCCERRGNQWFRSGQNQAGQDWLMQDMIWRPMAKIRPSRGMLNRGNVGRAMGANGSSLAQAMPDRVMLAGPRYGDQMVHAREGHISP